MQQEGILRHKAAAADNAEMEPFRSLYAQRA